MRHTIQADESGALLVPAECLGQVEPGASYAVEPHGNLVILLREGGEAERWWAATTPAERVAWLEEWTRGLPARPAITPEATRRDSLYE
jgi:hypothetical protein